MRMNKKIRKAIKKVAEDLSLLSPEEFAREMKKHGDGDIANILLETGALRNKGSFRVVKMVNKKDKLCKSCKSL